MLLRRYGDLYHISYPAKTFWYMNFVQVYAFFELISQGKEYGW